MVINPIFTLTTIYLALAQCPDSRIAHSACPEPNINTGTCPVYVLAASNRMERNTPERAATSLPHMARAVRIGSGLFCSRSIDHHHVGAIRCPGASRCRPACSTMDWNSVSMVVGLPLGVARSAGLLDLLASSGLMDLMPSTFQRQLQLRDAQYFVCKCTRCMDVDYGRQLKCTACRKGHLLRLGSLPHTLPLPLPSSCVARALPCPPPLPIRLEASGFHLLACRFTLESAHGAGAETSGPLPVCIHLAR